MRVHRVQSAEPVGSGKSVVADCGQELQRVQLVVADSTEMLLSVESVLAEVNCRKCRKLAAPTLRYLYAAYEQGQEA